LVAEVEIATEDYCLSLSDIVNQPKDWTDKSMNRKELIERLRCLPLDEPAEFTAVKDAVIVPRKWRCGLEKRFRWRRLRWGWGSQTFEFLSDGKAVTFWEWEEPRPRAPTAFMKTKLSSTSAASRRRATSSGLGTIGQDSEIPRGR